MSLLSDRALYILVAGIIVTCIAIADMNWPAHMSGVIQ